MSKINQELQEPHTLIFFNSHAQSKAETFTNVGHARDWYKQVRAEGFYTHYKLYKNGKKVQEGKIV